MTSKNKKEITIHSSAAEYLTFAAASGDNPESIEMRYQDENIWLTQKMMSELYGVTVAAINQHVKRIFDDGELSADATVKKYLIVQTEGSRQVSREIDHYSLQMIIAVGFKQAKLYAEMEFEKYRIVQDRLFESDFDRFIAVKSGGDSVEV